MGTLRFIHTADLHLDTPFKGLGNLPEPIFEVIQKSTFESFERIVAAAVDHQVDFVVISGDLYDGANRSLRAQLFLKKQFQRLAESGIEVFVIHGNHDHLSGKYVEISWPPNVHVFHTDQPHMIPFQKNGETLAHLYGYSYPERSVTEAIANDYEHVPGAPYHVALLHGSVRGNADHDTYAPFSVQELIKRPFNYWALGHIHKRSELHHDPPVVYPGNIQGLNRKETGGKGCFLVELTDTGSDLTFLDTARVVWQEVEVAESDALTRVEELLILLHQEKERIRSSGVHTVVNVKVCGKDGLGNDLQDWSTREDLLAELQEGEEDENVFVWLKHIHVEQMDKTVYEALQRSPFLSEMFEVFDKLETIEHPLEPMLKHRKARRFLSPEDLDADEIKQAAQALLMDTMTRGMRG